MLIMLMYLCKITVNDRTAQDSSSVNHTCAVRSFRWRHLGLIFKICPYALCREALLKFYYLALV